MIQIRILFVLLLMFLINPLLKAEDIFELQIEGASIGSSLYDHFDQKIIDGFKKHEYGNNKKFYKLEVLNWNIKKNKKYDTVGFYLITNDKNLKIHGLSGNIFFQNVNKCKKKMVEISNDISSLLNISFNDSSFKPTFDKNTYVHQMQTNFSKGGTIAISCYDWSKKIENEYNWADNLGVEVYSSDLATFIGSNS